MMRSAKLICFTLLKQSIIFIAVLAIVRGTLATGTTTTTTATKSEFVLFLEIVCGVRGEGGFGLGVEGWVRYGVGHGACAAKVGHIAEGKVCGGDE